MQDQDQDLTSSISMVSDNIQHMQRHMNNHKFE